MKDDTQANRRLEADHDAHICDTNCVTARTVIVIALALFFVSLVFG